MTLMRKRKIQIDVMDGDPGFDSIRKDELIRCKLYVDGNAIAFWTTKSNYEALKYHGLFIRDGKEVDCSGAINTTAVYEEKLKI